MPSTLDKSPDRPEGAPEAAGGDLVKRLHELAEPPCGNVRAVALRRAAGEIERLHAKLWAANEDCAMQTERTEAAEAELERTQAILTEVWVAATRARNALHAHNRPRFPAKLRTEVRDILDKALENSND